MLDRLFILHPQYWTSALSVDWHQTSPLLGRGGQQCSLLVWAANSCVPRAARCGMAEHCERVVGLDLKSLPSALGNSKSVGNATRIRSRRSFSSSKHGIVWEHCLHASTKCRPQSATPLGLPCSDSITKTRYGTSPHCPQSSYDCTGMGSLPIHGLTHPRILSPLFGFQSPPSSVIAVIKTMLTSPQNLNCDDRHIRFIDCVTNGSNYSVPAL